VADFGVTRIVDPQRGAEPGKRRNALAPKTSYDPRRS
jgi:hypothetical protein